MKPWVSDGELGKDPAERMAFVAIDPLNLIRVMPAEGRDDCAFSRLVSTLPENGPPKLQKNIPDEFPDKARLLKPVMQTQRVRLLAEIAVLIALSGALYLVKVFTLPEGGSVTLASMAPIFVLALRRGARIGMAGGVLFGLIALLEDTTAGIQPVGPAQVFLDYPLAFGLLGLAGFFQKSPLLGIVVGISARFCSHFVSGVLFFATYAPVGMSAYEYSAIYNGSFLLAEFVITALIMIGLIRLKALQLYL